MSVKKVVAERAYWNPDYGRAMAGAAGYSLMQRIFNSEIYYVFSVEMEDGTVESMPSDHPLEPNTCLALDGTRHYLLSKRCKQ